MSTDKIIRKKTRIISIGKVKIGGSSPIAVQSMTKTFTRDASATIRQIKKLEEAGCQIVRCAVPEEEDVMALKKIKKAIKIPLVADIHFNYRYALMAIDAGADKIRINPGNIGGKEKLKEVVIACKKNGIPIRIGVNSGSLEKDILKRFGHPNSDALVASALRNVRSLEDLNFGNIVISIKSTSVPTTIEAYRKLSNKVDYPLHIGITEAGIGSSGIIKSSAGIGALLAEGIGDTLRVSLTGDPVVEVLAGKKILQALELIKDGIEVISCPTCGRCRINIERIARQVEERTKGIKKSLKVAIMGCAVNGPGEAADADIGFAGGIGDGLMFKKGRIIRKIKEKDAVMEILREVARFK